MYIRPYQWYIYTTSPYFPIRIVEMSKLKDRIKLKKEEVDASTKAIVEEYDRKATEFQRSISTQLKAFAEQFLAIRDRIAAIMRRSDEETKERSQLETYKAVELEAKYTEMRDVVNSTTAKTITSCSAVRTTTQKWQETLVSGVQVFQTVLKRLNAVAPEHFIREAEKQQGDLRQKEAEMRSVITGVETDLRKNWGETEALRTAAQMQMEDFCRRSGKTIEDKRRVIEQRVEARYKEMMAQLEKTEVVLGLHR